MTDVEGKCCECEGGEVTTDYGFGIGWHDCPCPCHKKEEEAVEDKELDLEYLKAECEKLPGVLKLHGLGNLLIVGIVASFKSTIREVERLREEVKYITGVDGVMKILRSQGDHGGGHD